MQRQSRALSLFCVLVLLYNALGALGDAWPYTPWHTEGRNVINTQGKVVTLLGVNWPGAGPLMIPEGLQHASVHDIVDRLVKNGFNTVRHTYATESIDQIYMNGGNDITLAEACSKALGEAVGKFMLAMILRKNKALGWTENTTRLEVLASIFRVEMEMGLVVHLDNHVSKAQWCCSGGDGNGWWGDRHFHEENWVRGLNFMADWAKNHPNVVSMSLRNELRRPAGRRKVGYNWVNWAGNMTMGADAIYQANPNVLIVFGGMAYDTTLAPIVNGDNLWKAASGGAEVVPDADSFTPVVLDVDSYSWRDKAVFELHLYRKSGGDMTHCEAIKARLYRNGFSALGIDPPRDCVNRPTPGKVTCPPAMRQTPVWMTEFGQAQNSSLLNGLYINCLRNFFVENKVSFMVWSVAGSYYTRGGKVDFDDPWGLVNKQWSLWRDLNSFVRFWKPFLKDMGETNMRKLGGA